MIPTVHPMAESMVLVDLVDLAEIDMLLTDNQVTSCCCFFLFCQAR